MKMYEATPGHFIPVGQTPETMYQGDAMLNQAIECAGFDDDFNDYADGDITGAVITRFRGTTDTWVTREGKRIPVKGMSDAHIINTIRMLEHNKAEAVATYPALLGEAAVRNLGMHCEKTEQCADDVYCNCNCKDCLRTQCYRPGCKCTKSHSERDRISS